MKKNHSALNQVSRFMTLNRRTARGGHSRMHRSRQPGPERFNRSCRSFPQMLAGLLFKPQLKGFKA